MKTKVIILLAVVAVVTLSFTFATGSKADAKATEVPATQSNDEPAGGFMSEDKL